MNIHLPGLAFNATLPFDGWTVTSSGGSKVLVFSIPLRDLRLGQQVLSVYGNQVERCSWF